MNYCGVDEYAYLNRYTTLSRGSDGRLIPDPKYVCGDPATIKHGGVWMCEPHYKFATDVEQDGTVEERPSGAARCGTPEEKHEG